MSASNTDNEQKKKLEEYNEWKKLAHLLYDMIISHNLTWPTLTLQWLPEKTLNNGKYQQELLLGTHTNNLETNHLQYLLMETANNQKPSVSIRQKFDHDGEVN
ncbi:unnamed protein product [Rhizopus stolonifer]